jgi:hypothetical protein
MGNQMMKHSRHECQTDNRKYEYICVSNLCFTIPSLMEVRDPDWCQVSRSDFHVSHAKLQLRHVLLTEQTHTAPLHQSSFSHSPTSYSLNASPLLLSPFSPILFPTFPSIPTICFHFLLFSCLTSFTGAGIAQWYRAGLRAAGSGVQVPAGAGNLSLHHRPPSLLSNGYKGLFP